MSQPQSDAERKATAPADPIEASQPAASMTGYQSDKALAPDAGADVEHGGTANGRAASLKSASTGPVYQDDGVTKIEALYVVFGKGSMLYLLWGSIGLIAVVYALQASTTGTYLNFATGTFSRHALLATIATINWIIADMTSRPAALSVSLVFYCIGYIIVAASKSVQDVAGGEVLYTIGNDGLNFVKALIIADITNLQNRGLVNALITSPYIVTGFVAGYITEGISGFTDENWRWGYGMFIIMTPILMAPAIGVLFWGQRRARRLGAYLVADPGFAQRQVLTPAQRRASIVASLVSLFWQVDIIGLVLLGFALGLFLVPFSLAAGAEGGYANPSMIAMLVVGFVLFFVFAIYEIRFAPYPLMPKRVLNRSLIASCTINFFYFMSYYISGTYQSSWVFVVKPEWSDRDWTFWANTMNTGLCVFALVAGLVQRYTHQYKWSMIGGLALRVVGNGLALAATRNPSDALLVMSPVLVSIGAGFFTIGANLAAQASVPHADLAIASAILYLVTSIGGACGGAISGAIWTNNLLPRLTSYTAGALTPAELVAAYGDIRIARAAEPRAAVQAAYLDTAWLLELVCLVLSVIPFIAGFFATDFYLGTAHNAVEQKEVVIMGKDEVTDEKIRERAEEAEERARLRALGKGLQVEEDAEAEAEEERAEVERRARGQGAVLL